MSLATLRADPAAATQRNVYRTGPAKGSFDGTGTVVQGGRCTVAASEAEPGFFDLKAVANNYGSTDYFYPWLRNGVGWVQVPTNTPDGTVVMTGGVNGCTLVVTKHQNDYFFYHDGDSTSLKPGMTKGTEVAKVAPKDYDPLSWGQKAFESALKDAAAKGKKPVGDVSYGHFVVAVKKEGRFGMYVTGVMSLNGLARLPMGLTTCIVTFE